MEIELRFYRQRYNMDDEYYTGDRDIYCRLHFKSFKELKRKWNKMFPHLEGETYSAWHHGKLLCGGAFDPGDIDYIEYDLKRISLGVCI